MAVVEVVVVPLGTGSPSVSKNVARAVRVLEKEKDLRYQSTAMGTIIEGDLDKILVAIRKMHETMFSDEVMRVETSIRIDDRRDKPLSAEGKLEALLNELGESDEYFGGEPWW
ncbi:MAG: MTH1187 family thiamine-binding protein [Dehalococcoidia bacterium]